MKPKYQTVIGPATNFIVGSFYSIELEEVFQAELR
jgi:hypothetical protein